MDDDGLEGLLRVATLRHIVVLDFDLKRSHAHKPCGWRSLTFSCCIPTSSIQHLPIHALNHPIRCERLHPANQG